MTPNPTPKARFLESKDNIAAHHKLLDERATERGIDFALMQYARELADNPPNDMTNCAAHWLRLQGAHDFVKVLKTLAEVPAPVKRVETPNLDHTVR